MLDRFKSEKDIKKSDFISKWSGIPEGADEMKKQFKTGIITIGAPRTS